MKPCITRSIIDKLASFPEPFWCSDWLEASCAAHIANNLVLFILNGFGIKTITSNGGQLKGVILVTAMYGIYLAVIIFMDKKFNWFERTPKETGIPG